MLPMVPRKKGVKSSSDPYHLTRPHGVDCGTVCWADLSTPDPARAAEFYKSLFGWDATKGANDSSGYLHIKNGDEFIGGIPPVELYDSRIPPHWLLYFQVSNCDESVAKAKSMNAELLLPPSDVQNVGRMASLETHNALLLRSFSHPRSKST